MTCTCPEVFAGPHPTGSKNWNPDCDAHGVASAWYNSDEQISQRNADRERSLRLQRLAREKRNS